MGLIHVLDDLVANQIAAGEVVERPAAAVKELMENAIDAGSKKIHIGTRDGGLTLIEVQDDGVGIEPEDVETAFLRHATSKLRELTDLTKMRSLGFRGEALPSIAAVSKVTVRTRTAHSEEGQLLHYEAGQLLERKFIGCSQGTRITVQDLFYNTPARLKFVRSLQTENTHIVDVVSRAAMARPDISFRLQIDDRVAIQTPGDGQLLSAFASIYGLSLAKSTFGLCIESPDYAIAGLLVAPEFARKSRNAMWFSVNGRPIRNIALGNAVLDGYYTLVPKGRFPVVALALSMTPTLVDVNVHPSKTEVRFSEERDICVLLTEAVKQSLKVASGSPVVQSLSKGTITEQDGLVQSLSASGKGVETSLHNHHALPTLSENASLSVQVAETSPSMSGRSLLGTNRTPSTYGTAYTNATKEPIPLDKRDAASMDVVTQVALNLFASEGYPQEVVTPVAQLRAVAQVLKLVIVAEDGEDIYLIDQHAAHERVLYEKFRKRMREQDHYAMELLVPITLELNVIKIELLFQHQAQWTSFGLVIEPFGENVIRITHVPSIWEGLDIEQLAHDVIFDVLEDRTTSVFRSELEDKVILRACKAAIKANSTMDRQEMDALLEAMQKLDNPFTCPHGRPTAIRITRSQLEKEFKRTL